ncbi:MAG: DUF4870 domain-containing protein, partial [Phycicoccus sp.]
MSDSTPRPDQTPNDPTAPPPPPPPADAGAEEVRATAPPPPPPATPPPATPPADAAPATDTGVAYPPPAQSSSQQPPAQSYTQQQQPAAQSYPQQPAAQPYPQQPYPANAAPMSPTQERQWGMLAHIIGGVGFVTTAVGGFIGTLVVYLVYKDRGPFVRAHAANSLNVQITTFIGLVIGVITAFFIVGIFILVAVVVWTVVVHIIGAI